MDLLRVDFSVEETEFITLPGYNISSNQEILTMKKTDVCMSVGKLKWVFVFYLGIKV
jgi:hypothetical protein